MTMNDAVRQLERSERGQMTCKLLHDFLASNTVKFLDEPNQHAVAVIVASYMIGDSPMACAVIDELAALIERNQWVAK